MEAFKTLISRAFPLPIEHIDTDQIIPARFLKATDKKGFCDNLFRDWRYDNNVEERAWCRLGVGWGEQRDEPFAEGTVKQVGTHRCVPGLGPGGQVQGPVGAEPGKGRGVSALREDGTVGVRGAADARDEKREDVAEGTVAAAEGAEQGAVEEGSSVGEREDGLRSALREDAAVE